MSPKQLRQLRNTIFHTTNQFIAYKSWGLFSVYDRSYDSELLRLLLQDPDPFLRKNSAIEIIKADQSSTVAKIFIDGKYLIIKRHNLKSIWHRIKRAFSMSRAAKNWRNAHYLKLLDIATAKPVAMIEKRWGPFCRESYFINEYIPNQHLLQLANSTYSIEQMEAIASNIKKLFAVLNGVQLAHGDMKATNILIVNNQPLLLDLDAMNLYRTHWRWERAAKADWQRFMKNWHSYPELQAIFQKIKS